MVDRTADLVPQIKKNTAAHELKPSDILIERFTAWKMIVKMLICEWSPAACQLHPAPALTQCSLL